MLLSDHQRLFLIPVLSLLPILIAYSLVQTALLISFQHTFILLIVKIQFKQCRVRVWPIYRDIIFWSKLDLNNPEMDGYYRPMDNGDPDKEPSSPLIHHVGSDIWSGMGYTWHRSCKNVPTHVDVYEFMYNWKNSLINKVQLTERYFEHNQFGSSKFTIHLSELSYLELFKHFPLFSVYIT